MNCWQKKKEREEQKAKYLNLLELQAKINKSRQGKVKNRKTLYFGNWLSNVDIGNDAEVKGKVQSEGSDEESERMRGRK